jgi:hypothetical protein
LKRDSYINVLVVILMALGLGALVMGCMGGGTTTQTTASQQASLPSTTTETTAGLGAEAFSTFENKDPFIQQATTTSAPVSTTQSPNSTTSTTYNPWTTTTRPQGTTTTYHGGSTTTLHVTTTTSPHRHTLKILSVGDVAGSPAVTFQVDNSIYKDKRKGDVVSSSWGQVKVLDISTSSKVATLLHGSETLVLTVGQVVFD